MAWYLASTVRCRLLAARFRHGSSISATSDISIPWTGLHGSCWGSHSFLGLANVVFGRHDSLMLRRRIRRRRAVPAIADTVWCRQLATRYCLAIARRHCRPNGRLKSAGEEEGIAPHRQAGCKGRQGALSCRPAIAGRLRQDESTLSFLVARRAAANPPPDVRRQRESVRPVLIWPNGVRRVGESNPRGRSPGGL